MGVDTRPPWLTPIVYDDEPIPPDPTVRDETPIDYGRRPDRDEVLGEDLDEEDLDDFDADDLGREGD